MSPSALADMQRRFRGAVLGGDDAPLAPFIQADGSAARLAVHRTTVQSGLIDVLAAAFPVTRRVIGSRTFAGLARRFIAASPPRAAYLSAYGDGFADFVAREDLLPYLADVARLEWARAEAYFAADAPPLDPARLTALTPEALERAVLTLHPATRLVDSRFPIHRIWQVNQPEAADVPPVDMSTAQSVLVTRRGFDLVTRLLSPADAAFMSAVSRGAPLAEAAEAQSGFDLQQALQDHFMSGTFQDELSA
jgi:hypothetical protein